MFLFALFMPFLGDILSSSRVGPPVEKCYSLLRGEDLMQVQSNSINLVFGRDLRRNVLYASTMAVEMSGASRVCYVNTYAGEDLLRRAFSLASGAPAHGDVWVETVATGAWDIEPLRKAIAEHDLKVLILNSFEFSAWNRYHREQVTRDLLILQREFSLTVIVFSNEIKRELEAHSACRGAIGMLVARSETVSKVGDEWRSVEVPQMMAPKGQIGEDDIKRGRVHEKQTLKKQDLPRKFGGNRPNPSVEIPRDTGLSYHYGDFWEDPFHRGPMVSYQGKDMALFARTPLLHQYLLDHPDTTFMLGNTPTEAELMGSGQWVEGSGDRRQGCRRPREESNSLEVNGLSDGRKWGEPPPDPLLRKAGEFENLVGETLIAGR